MGKNPYEILGVPENASDEQLKTTYRELIKKYHPDSYVGTPLVDVAQEKTQEINAAYDEIMNARRAAGHSSDTASSGNVGGHGSQNQSATSYPHIRRMIQSNLFAEAEQALDAVPLANRDAEWYFLKGTICFSRGWLEDATNFFSTACRLDPHNGEYRAALNRIIWQKGGNFGGFGSGGYRGGSGNGGCGPCEFCQALICADCCCECMGGDLIRCC